MCKCKTVVMTLLFAALCTPILASQVSDILKAMDKLQRLNKDVTAKVKIVQKDRDQGVKVMESVYYAKDLNDQFLIVMTEPESEKGNGYLKVGKNFWMYRRNTRTFQHINRDESIAGTDADAGDFEAPKYFEHYEAETDENGREMITETTLGKAVVYQVDIKAKIPDVDYPRKRLWVKKDGYLPLKLQNFSLSDTLMNTQYYLKYSKVDGQFIPIKQLVVDEFEPGNKTLWDIVDLSFAPIDDKIFTKAYLENLSK